MHDLQTAKFPPGILRAGLLLAVRIVEQVRQPLQPSRVGDRVVDSFQDAPVVGEDVLARPQCLEVQSHGALVRTSRRLPLGVGMQTAFLLESTRELRVWYR